MKLRNPFWRRPFDFERHVVNKLKVPFNKNETTRKRKILELMLRTPKFKNVVRALGSYVEQGIISKTCARDTIHTFFRKFGEDYIQRKIEDTLVAKRFNQALDDSGKNLIDVFEEDPFDRQALLVVEDKKTKKRIFLMFMGPQSRVIVKDP
jgi:hypothetical protein